MSDEGHNDRSRPINSRAPKSKNYIPGTITVNGLVMLLHVISVGVTFTTYTRQTFTP